MIYVYLNGATRGPFSIDQVQSYLRDGLLQPSDMAAEEPGGDLRAVSTWVNPAAPVVTVAPPPPAPVVPNENKYPPLPASALGAYARATLAASETPFYKTSLHWIVFVRYAFLALLGFLFLAMPFAIGVQALTGSQIGWFALPLPIFLMLPPALAWASSELVITDLRILIKTGVIRHQTLEMFIAKVESIAIDQSFLGRLCNYGTVVVRGTGGFEEHFETIGRPLEFRNWVQRVQHSGGN